VIKMVFGLSWLTMVEILRISIFHFSKDGNGFIYEVGELIVTFLPNFFYYLSFSSTFDTFKTINLWRVLSSIDIFKCFQKRYMI
jgi:hypothetical protein